MGSRHFSIACSGAAALAVAVACMTVLQPAAARAQDRGPAAEAPGFFESVGRWFDRQAQNVKSTFGGARSTVEGFSHEAGMAASKTVDGAKDVAKDVAVGAADAVARLPKTGVVSGHEKCRVAPNGGPDCTGAADSLCRTKGFKSGASVDMTTAKVCPPEVWIAGRTTGPECRTETFVSRALCQ